MRGHKSLIGCALAVIAEHAPKFLTCANLVVELRKRHIFTTSDHLSSGLYKHMLRGRLIRKRVGPRGGWGYTLSSGAWMIEACKEVGE